MKTEFFDEDGRCCSDDLGDLDSEISNLVLAFIKKNAKKIKGLHELRGIGSFLYGSIDSVILGSILAGKKGWESDIEQWGIDDATQEE